MQTYKIGIIGAGSLKGSEIVRYLIKTDFPYSSLVLLDQKKYDNKLLNIERQKLIIKQIKEEYLKDLQLVFCVNDGSFGQYLDYITNNGIYLIEIGNEIKYPLIFDDTSITKIDKAYSLPSSVSVAIGQVLKPLQTIANIEKVVYTSLQSLSDLDSVAIDEFESQLVDYVNYRIMNASILPLPNAKKHYPIALNVIPQTSDFNFQTLQTKDEFFQSEELRIILNNPDLIVSNTALRVPLVRSDIINIYIETSEKIEIFDYISNLLNDENILFLENVLELDYPMPIIVEGQDKVYVGRLRRVSEKAICIYICCDNLAKGTALCAIQNARKLLNYELQ